jgi:hypothetical protein
VKIEAKSQEKKTEKPEQKEEKTKVIEGKAASET